MSNKVQKPGKKGGLGKGLNSLLGLEEGVELDLDTKKKDQTTLISISVDTIRPNPKQPRKVFIQSELEELAQSLKEDGVVQPLICLLYTSPSPRD